MQIKNTIPAEFISNSALLKNIEHMVPRRRAKPLAMSV